MENYSTMYYKGISFVSYNFKIGSKVFVVNGNSIEECRAEKNKWLLNLK